MLLVSTTVMLSLLSVSSAMSSLALSVGWYSSQNTYLHATVLAEGGERGAGEGGPDLAQRAAGRVGVVEAVHVGPVDDVLEVVVDVAELEGRVGQRRRQLLDHRPGLLVEAEGELVGGLLARRRRPLQDPLQRDAAHGAQPEEGEPPAGRPAHGGA